MIGRGGTVQYMRLEHKISKNQNQNNKNCQKCQEDLCKNRHPSISEHALLSKMRALTNYNTTKRSLIEVIIVKMAVKVYILGKPLFCSSQHEL